MQIFGLLDYKLECIVVLRNVGNYLPIEKA